VADERIAAVFARAGGGVIGYKRAVKVNDRRITHLAPQQELGGTTQAAGLDSLS